jgi:HEPN domain-containing protein
MNNASRLWLQRAKSALQLGKITKTEEIWYEDLCFQLQQAAEKALKGYLIFLGVDPPRTHSFNIILQELGKYIQYPVELEEVLNLNDYAVQARYPGEYTPIEEEEYEEAVRIATYVCRWVEESIKKTKK